VQLDLDATRVHLHADPARVQQIFWNLINNAVKFTPSEGEIRISTRNGADNELEVEIADNGLGIEMESLPKIFDAFEQASRTKLGGLGLGLAISKTLVEAHKGTILAESDGRDRGATFTVTFHTVEKVAGKRAAPVAHTTPTRQAMRILLVEDHEDTNRSLTNLLRLRGYDVESANNVASGRDLADSRDFDVLISDLGLPDGSGIDLIEWIRAKRPVYAIALTGFGMEEDVRRSREAGFRHHLVKPIDLNKLDTLIQESATAEIQ
jgi:CheY-like chemotaxis protein